MKRTGTLWLALFLGAWLAPHCGAAVYYSNGSAANVQALHDGAQNGDTIVLPVGVFVWTTGITFTKGITLQGTGIGNTIIKDGLQSGSLISWNLAAGYVSRLTGIEFQNGGRTETQWPNVGILNVSGSNTDGSQFRWDNCKWQDLHGWPVFYTVLGVIDHNQFARTTAGIWGPEIYVYDDKWDGGTGSLGWGDKSWTASTNFGSSQFLFIEDNTFTCQANIFPIPPPALDGWGGQRAVFRHNTLYNYGVGPNHGTETAQRHRGGRAVEVYRNTIVATSPPSTSQLAQLRSGVMLFHDNTVRGWTVPNNPLPSCALQADRTFNSFSPWGGADGTNSWDSNSGTYFSGFAAGNSNNRSITVSGANWIPNQWVGYTVTRTSNNCASQGVNFAVVLSNTTNTITYESGGGYSPDLQFCAGDSLKVYKVQQALDSCGRAGGSLISGDSPTPPPNGNDQATQPCYSWGNSDEFGNQINFSQGLGSAGVIRPGEHFYNDTPMPGYGEYVYPHPLGGGPPPPTPTPLPTATPSPTATPTPTPRPTPTATITPRPTSTPAPTATPRGHRKPR